MLLGILLLGAIPLPALATNDPPSGGGNVTGDWVVNDVRSYSGVTINVAGNLIIASGGSLTLSNVKLHINGPSAGAYRIEVQSGGKLYTDTGTMVMTATGNNYRFQLNSGSTAELRDTTVSKVGVLGNQYGRGIYIGSDNVVLDNCTVQSGYEGVHIEYASPRLVNSTFKDHQYSAVYNDHGLPLIDNCTVLNSGHYGGQAAIYSEYANSTGKRMRISNCTIADNEHGVYLNQDTAALFENNTVTNSTMRGLWVRLSNPLVRNNNITGNRENGVFLEEASPVIERNNITRNGQPAQLSSGIYIYYGSYPLIQDNYIASNTDTGVHIRPQCAPTLRNNIITANTNIGVKFYYCGNARLDGNNISMNYDGLNAQGSTPKITGNALWVNQNDGFHADGGDMIFEGNAVTGSGMSGIHALGAVRLLAGNSTFTNNQWGISAEAGSNILLLNGNFSGQFKEAFKCDGTSTLDWLVNAPARIDGNNALLRGNLTVVPGGRLALTELHFDVSSSASLRRSIELRSGGELALEGVNLTAYDPAFNYKFTSEGTLAVANSTVEEVGWAPGDTAGLYVSGGTARFLSSSIARGYNGLVLRGASAALEGCTLEQNEQAALDASGSVFECRNGTVFGGSQYLLILDSSSRAEMVNTTFDQGKVSLLDGPSVVNVHWYLAVRARWAGGDPVEGATVRLTDRLAGAVFVRTTDSSGLTPPEQVQQYSQRSASTTSHTPHTLNLTRGQMSSESQVTVDRSLVFDITLTDSNPPAIQITSPANPSFLATQTVEMRGTASDDGSGLRNVEVSWNNATWYNASTSDGFAGWNYTFQLIPAAYTLRAKATDWAGQTRTAGVVVTIEVTAPFLVIDTPREGLLTNQSQIPLNGKTSRDALVTALVNGVPARAGNSAGVISGTLNLTEGQNLVEVTVTDLAGNFNRTARNVTLDTIPPLIELELPSVSYTNQQSIAVNGSTDGDAVTVNAMMANLTGGRFSKTIILNYGSGTTDTSIDVVARDAAGNINRTTIHVLRDLTAPGIRITSPPRDVSITNLPTSWVNGTTEPENTLTVNGVPVTLDGGGNFSLQVDLQEGVNVIEIEARDPAGNTRKFLRTVHRDTVVPPLSVTSPLNGSRTYSTEADLLGATEAGMVLTVNGEEINVGVDGNFSKLHIPLALGSNNITVIARDSAGNIRTLTITVFRDENPPPPPRPPVEEPAKGELETLLPWIFIIVIIIGGVGAGAWVAVSGRKKPGPVPPRRPSAPAGRQATQAEQELARRRGASPADRPNTADELYGKDYARKFSRPAGAAHAAPAQTFPEPAAAAQPEAAQPVSWGDEPEELVYDAPAAPVETYEPPDQGRPGGQALPMPANGYAPLAEEPDTAPAHSETATKAVDSEIDDLLKKIGDAAKKK